MGFKQTEMIKKEISVLENAISTFTRNKYPEVAYLKQFKSDLEKILKADEEKELKR